MSTRAQTNTMAFVAGITAGSIIAMLFTPKNGEETRAEIKNKVQTARDKARQASMNTMDKVNSGLDTAKQKMDQGAEMAKSKSNKLKSKNSDSDNNFSSSSSKELPDSFKNM